MRQQPLGLAAARPQALGQVALVLDDIVDQLRREAGVVTRSGAVVHGQPVDSLAFAEVVAHEGRAYRCERAVG